MSGPISRLPVVKMSWEKNSKKKPILLFNFCFLIHFDFSNKRIFTFSDGSKVMNPKNPRCNCAFVKVSKDITYLNKTSLKQVTSVLVVSVRLFQKAL